jgi:hypothetical protein
MEPGEIFEDWSARDRRKRKSLSQEQFYEKSQKLSFDKKKKSKQQSHEKPLHKRSDLKKCDISLRLG